MAALSGQFAGVLVVLLRHDQHMRFRLRVDVFDQLLEHLGFRLSHVRTQQHVPANVFERQRFWVNECEPTDARSRGHKCQGAAATAAADDGQVFFLEPFGFLRVAGKYRIDHFLFLPVLFFHLLSLQVFYLHDLFLFEWL